MSSSITATIKSLSNVEDTFVAPTENSMLLTSQPIPAAEEEVTKTEKNIENEKQQILRNFILMAILFSACHGTAVSCLDLAYARLGDLGGWQSGTLYLTYTGSAILGATDVVKKLGARNAITLSMIIYCVYIGCFLIATLVPDFQYISAISGAAIGGIGAGFMWTAQGSYFTQTTKKYSILAHDVPYQNVSSFLGGIFAFIYLIEEVTLKLISSAVIKYGYTWGNVFSLYFIIAVVSCILMPFVKNYDTGDNGDNGDDDHDGNHLKDQNSKLEISKFYEINAALRLLRTDRKMKYLIGLNAVFAVTAAFLISYVSSEVEPVVLSDSKSIYIGVLFSITSIIAAIMSLLFGFLAQKIGKGIIITIGAMAFFMVGFMFVLYPDVQNDWNRSLLILLFTFQGIGRATFESTLRATFADMFSYEKEGAFANIIFQNGSMSTICYFTSSFISPLTFELFIIILALGAIWGYWMAYAIFKDEEERKTIDEWYLK